MVLARYGGSYSSMSSVYPFFIFTVPPFALQFPTLGFIVERYWEIQAHEPEEFWTINFTHRSDEGIATFNWM